jgi:hypothetical protein
MSSYPYYLYLTPLGRRLTFLYVLSSALTQQFVTVAHNVRGVLLMICMLSAFAVVLHHNTTSFTRSYITTHRHVVAQLVESLHHKPEGHGFDSRWRQWNFSLI